jgi:hypothetical protein
MAVPRELLRELEEMPSQLEQALRCIPADRAALAGGYLRV